MSSRDGLVDWSQEDRDYLAGVMQARAHSQEAVCEKLRKLGAGGAACQPNLSKWLSVDGPSRIRASSKRAIDAYCSAIQEDRAEATFGSVVGDLVTERVLSRRQRTFVNRLERRIETGPPLTPEDERTLRWIGEMHGLI